MKKLIIAACAMFMFGAVAQAQSLNSTDAKKAETVDAAAKKAANLDAPVVKTANSDADMNEKAAEAASKKAPAVTNNPYTAERKAAVKAEKDAKSSKAAKAVKAKKVKKVKAKVDY